MERTNLPACLTLFNKKLNSLQRYDVAQKCGILHRVISVCLNITSTIYTIAIFKTFVKKIMVQTVYALCPWSFTVWNLNCLVCKGSWVVCIKQNMNCKFQPSSMFVFLAFHLNGLLKVVQRLKIFQHTKFMIPLWLMQVLHSPQPFWRSWIYGIKIYGIHVNFNSMISLLNSIKIDQLVQTLLGGIKPAHRRTDRHSMDIL
jgi:hypothetical protein